MILLTASTAAQIHQHVDSEGNMGLRFQHPAPIDLGALGNVGWREEEAMKVRDCICDEQLHSAVSGIIGRMHERCTGLHAGGRALSQLAQCRAGCHLKCIKRAFTCPTNALNLAPLLFGSFQVAAAQPAAAAPVAPAGGAKTYTMAEVAVHNTEDSAWFVYENRVYDATPFLEEHPGGAESILLVAGKRTCCCALIYHHYGSISRA